MPRSSWFLPRVFCLLLISAVAVLADPKEPKKDAPYTPFVHKESKEGEEAIKRFQFDKSLKVDLWAAEPFLANPVCFSFDEKGRCYVAETFRFSDGVTDNRSHMNWLDEELACRTVEDRVEMYKRHAKENFAKTYEKERDRVRLLEDTTGSGKADKATVFRDDFGRAQDGLGAGLLARNGNVYFTCVPDLWLLKDTKGTGRADVKESLSTGYGVHVAFIGHDCHGLRMGPDGKLYFSIGDRGLNVKTKEGKHLFNPDCGAVLRCDLDGANLEIVHTGLRNPQELAFDDHGNLFTVDNNSDSGDRARFVYIVEGGDSGWRIGYQYGSEMHDPKVVKQGNRGPFNYEKLWEPHFAGQAAYIVPPLNNFADGPSGFTHYPGLGLSDKYNGHFFLCDFRGNSGGSGVFSFTTKPKGAAFEMVNPKHFVWNVLATDCDFGPDCAFYISDWTEGWSKPGKGRIYKVSDPDEQKKEAVMEVKKILGEGFGENLTARKGQRQIERLVELLAHPHQQIRTEAQFALAKRGVLVIKALTAVAKESKNPLARLHAIWGLGMIGRKDPKVFPAIVELTKDENAEVRAQAAKVLGIHRSESETAALIDLLKDSEPRVQFFALQSLGNAGSEIGEKLESLQEERIVRIVKANADRDVYLRHAAARALAQVLTTTAAAGPAFDPAPSVQMTTVLALRQKVLAAADPRKVSLPILDTFLRSTDPLVVNEAARLIHDLDVRAELPKLAAILSKPNIPVEALFRSLNANFRLGKPENAIALANFAGKRDADDLLRVLALKMLGDWAKPGRRDFITGLTQDIPPREATVAADALKSKFGGIFAGSASVQKEAATVAGKLGIKEVGPFLFGLVTDLKSPATARIEALKALESLKDKRIGEAVAVAIVSTDPKLRNAGRAVLSKTKPQEVIAQLKEVLTKENTIEKQGAFALLGEIKAPEVDDLLEGWLDKLAKKEVPDELHLDILESAAKRKSTRLERQLRNYEEGRAKNDELAPFRETLLGGDPERGRHIFLNKADVSCQRCHRLDGEGGDVGPPLNGIGAKQKRDYLLESLLLPSKQIAKGYDSVLITKTDGKSLSGVLKSEDAKEVKVMTAEGVLVTVKKEDIEDRKTTKSAMPDDLAKKLTKRELRDLVEFLAELKEEWKK